MSFASVYPIPRLNPESSEANSQVSIDGWPTINLKYAKDILRLTSDVTDTRILESLRNSAQHVIRELRYWRQDNEVLSEHQIDLYTRAVLFSTKADLIERYKDFDLTRLGSSRAEDLSSSIDEARRNVRWAISDLMEKPRVTIEVL